MIFTTFEYFLFILFTSAFVFLNFFFIQVKRPSTKSRRSVISISLLLIFTLSALLWHLVSKAWLLDAVWIDFLFLTTTFYIHAEQSYYGSPFYASRFYHEQSPAFRFWPGTFANNHTVDIAQTILRITWSFDILFSLIPYYGMMMNRLVFVISYTYCHGIAFSCFPTWHYHATLYAIWSLGIESFFEINAAETFSVLIGIFFFASGFAKIRNSGTKWITSPLTGLQKFGDRIQMNSSLIAFGAISGELFYPLMFYFFPNYLIFIISIYFHVVIYFAMGIQFYCQSVAYLLFFKTNTDQHFWQYQLSVALILLIGVMNRIESWPFTYAPMFSVNIKSFGDSEKDAKAVGALLWDSKVLSTVKLYDLIDISPKPRHAIIIKNIAKKKLWRWKLFQGVGFSLKYGRKVRNIILEKFFDAMKREFPLLDRVEFKIIIGSEKVLIYDVEK